MRLIDADTLTPKAQEIIGAEASYKAYAIMDAILTAPTVDVATGINVPDKWIAVKDRLPVETHSIWYPFYGTKKWSNAMWREQSDKVLVTVAFKDGTKIVTTGETHDGVWNTTISRTLEPVVTHWQAMPEPPKEEEKYDKG